MKHILASIAITLMIFTAFVAGKHYAVTHLEIETDGDGDSAIVTLDGQSHLYGINGYTLDLDGTICCPLD